MGDNIVSMMIEIDKEEQGRGGVKVPAIMQPVYPLTVAPASIFQNYVVLMISREAKRDFHICPTIDFLGLGEGNVCLERLFGSPEGRRERREVRRGAFRGCLADAMGGQVIMGGLESGALKP